MRYIFKGTLAGLLCADCAEPLFGMTLRLYRAADRRELIAEAVADPKDTFLLLEPEQVEAKAPRLIGEAVIDERGGFTVELTEKHYDGGALEVDVFCGTKPGGGRPPKPLQASITTLQPRWRQGQEHLVAAWEYALPHRYWCALRGRLGAWVICGRVRHCKTQAPIVGLRVRAYDVDWLQDDALGDAVTDAAGHFRIEYDAAAFKKTIFPGLALEWTSGPDLYFRVETASGTVLLAEPRARGRQGDRQNVGPCFCAELCVESDVPEDRDEPLAAFAALGGYKYATHIHSTIGGSGLTKADNRAFYGFVRLNGVLPRKLGGAPLEYRFEVCAKTATGAPAGLWTPIPPSAWGAVEIGLNEYLVTLPGGATRVETRPVVVDPANPTGDVQHAAIVDGWVRVPQDSNWADPGEGLFVPNGNMLLVDTARLATSPPISVAGVVAGEPSTAHGALLAQNQHIGLRMRVRQVGASGAGIDANTCEHVAIENTRYHQVAKGGAWSPRRADGELGVASVDLLELRAGGCAALQTTISPVITCAHPNLGPVTLSMQGPPTPGHTSGTYHFSVPAPSGGELVVSAASPATPAAPLWSFAALPNCAYVVDLSATLLLTTGDSHPLPITDRVGYCKREP